jgi:hypothetical protein
MPNPILLRELQQGSRRDGWRRLWRFYSIWLLAQCILLFWNYWLEIEAQQSLSKAQRHARDVPTVRAGELTGRFVNSYMEIFVEQHFLLLVLATPPFVAGKLFGRLAQVGMIALAGLPFISLVGGFGSVEGFTLVSLAAVTAGLLFALGAASILSSVWSKDTRSAVLHVYAWMVCGIVLVAVASLWAPTATLNPFLAWLAAVMRCLNPIYVLEPSWQHTSGSAPLERLLMAVGGWSVLGVVCTGLAVWRLKPAYLRQLEGQGRPRRPRRLPALRRPVADDPIAWRERDVEGLPVVGWVRRVPLGLQYVALVPGTTAAFWLLGEAGAVLAVLVPFAAVSVVGIRASAAVCSERERQTWEMLLLTPLDTSDLLRGKVRGVMEALYPYLIGYAVATVFLLALEQPHVAITAWVCLVLCWSAMYYMGAVGILWSAQSRSSWKSLLATLAHGYISMLALYFGASVAISVLSCCVLTSVQGAPFVQGISWLRTAPVILTILLVYGYIIFLIHRVLVGWAESSLVMAEMWVNKHERTWTYNQGGWHYSHGR